MDDELSPETRRLLDQEVREAVGDDAADTPSRGQARSSGGGHSPLVVELASHRIALGLTFLVLVVVGVAIWLSTGSWWALPAALAVHAAGTLIVAAGALQLTTETEHASPALAARLEEEGVVDPDHMLTELVDEVGDGEQGSGNERTVPSGEDPARAASEQRRATTPSADPSRPVPGPDKIE